MKTRKYACWSAQFCYGGAGYGLLEILWRGYTHISMLITGGICFWLLIRISKSEWNLPSKTLLGGMCITALEFITGCIVNLWLGLRVWDYSAEPCQLLGQVCIRFSLLWCLFSVAVIPLCRIIPEWWRTWRTEELAGVMDTSVTDLTRKLPLDKA